MKIILAKLEDLNKIKKMYTKIIENMYVNEIKIWDEYYPNEAFEDDIKKQNLYILKENDIILGAFAMHEHENFEDGIEWQDIKEKAYLLNRLGVNIEYLREGIGQKIISGACEIAKKQDAKYLRLLVSELNTPAINLYLKCKLKKVNGIYRQKVYEDIYLNEYGFEIKL